MGRRSNGPCCFFVTRYKKLMHYVITSSVFIRQGMPSAHIAVVAMPHHTAGYNFLFTLKQYACCGIFFSTNETKVKVNKSLDKVTCKDICEDICKDTKLVNSITEIKFYLCMMKKSFQF